MTEATSSQLAQMFGVSPQRIAQLCTAGILKMSAGGFPLAESVAAYVNLLKTDEAGQRARTRHMNSRAASLEMRNRRELRQLVTVDELRAITDPFVSEALNVAQAQSQQFYDFLGTRLPDAMEVRQLTHEHYRHMRTIALQWGAAVAALVKEIQTTYLPGDRRLDNEIARLMAAGLDNIDGPAH